MIHELKVLPEHFNVVRNGEKIIIARSLYDYDLKDGDTLIFREWDNGTNKYTGRYIPVDVTNIQRIEVTGLGGMSVMDIKIREDICVSFSA